MFPVGSAGDVASAQLEQDLRTLANGLGISIEEARERQDMRGAAQGLYDAVYADPIHFAGAFQSDEGGTWRVVVLVIGNGGPPESIRALVPPGVPVDFVPADYSLDQLREVHDEVVAFWKAIDPSLTAVDGINLDTTANRIVVEFASHDYPDLRLKFSDAFGPIVTFRVVEPAAT